MVQLGEGFRDLIVWQKAYQLVLEIYKITKKFPKYELFGLTSQLTRAAVSVPANIAEGYERQHKKEYIQFLTIARGSLGEVETYLMLAKDLEYVEKDTYNNLEEKRQEIGRLLRGLTRSLANGKGQGTSSKGQGKILTLDP